VTLHIVLSVIVVIIAGTLLIIFNQLIYFVFAFITSYLIRNLILSFILKKRSLNPIYSNVFFGVLFFILILLYKRKDLIMTIITTVFGIVLFMISLYYLKLIDLNLLFEIEISEFYRITTMNNYQVKSISILMLYVFFLFGFFT